MTIEVSETCTNCQPTTTQENNWSRQGNTQYDMTMKELCTLYQYKLWLSTTLNKEMSGKWEARYMHFGKGHNFDMFLHVYTKNSTEFVIHGFSKDEEEKDELYSNLGVAVINGSIKQDTREVEFSKTYRGQSSHVVDYEGTLKSFADKFVITGLYWDTDSFTMTKVKDIKQ